MCCVYQKRQNVPSGYRLLLPMCVHLLKTKEIFGRLAYASFSNWRINATPFEVLQEVDLKKEGV